MAIIDAKKFLPEGVINILRSTGNWNVPLDQDWTQLVQNLEERGISTIRASVNYKAIEDDVNLVSELLTNYIQSNLMNPLVHNEGMQENGAITLEKYNNLIALIKESQKEFGIYAEDKSDNDETAGILFFNKD